MFESNGIQHACLTRSPRDALLAMLTTNHSPTCHLQVGFGTPCGSDDAKAGANGEDSSLARHSGQGAAATVHLLNADDGRWPLVEAARGAMKIPNAGWQDATGRQDEMGLQDAAKWSSLQMQAEPDGDSNPAGAICSQLARVAGGAVAFEPDIVLVRDQSSKDCRRDHSAPASSADTRAKAVWQAADSCKCMPKRAVVQVWYAE